MFFTPIDFHALAMAGTALATRPRVSVPVDRLDPETCALTGELDGERVHARADAAGLGRAATLWPEERVREWFGRDRTRLFWYMPQVGCFGGAPIVVDAPRWPPSHG